MNKKNPPSLDELFLEKWLNDDFSTLERLRQRIDAAWHGRFPRPVRVWAIGSWVSRTLLACSAPGLALLFGTLKDATLAATAATILFAGNVVSDFLSQLAKEKTRSRTDHSMIVRIGELLNTTRGAVSRHDGGAETAISALLGIIETCCRAVTQCDEDEISVTLLQYPIGSDVTEILIRRRDPGNKRPVGALVPTANLVGHRACQSDPNRPHIVHRLRDFGEGAMVSPSQSQVNYQAIFIIPLQSGSNGNRTLQGFVSVDCVRPYAFYGNRGRDIAVYCRPVINLLCELI